MTALHQRRWTTWWAPWRRGERPPAQDRLTWTGGAGGDEPTPIPETAPPGQEYAQELELVKLGVNGTATQFWRVFAYRNDKLLIPGAFVVTIVFLTGDVRVWNLALLPPACMLFYVLYWLLSRRRSRRPLAASQSGLPVSDEPANNRVGDARGNSK